MTQTIFQDSIGFNGAFAAEVQSDGKLVVAGGQDHTDHSYFVVTRYLGNGEPDPSFSGDGIATTDFGSNEAAAAIALQPDGKIVAAGHAPVGTNLGFALARYLPDGTLDASFDGDGKVTTDFGKIFNVPTAVAIQPGGHRLGRSFGGTQPGTSYCRAIPRVTGTTATG